MLFKTTTKKQPSPPVLRRSFKINTFFKVLIKIKTFLEENTNLKFVPEVTFQIFI